MTQPFVYIPEAVAGCAFCEIVSGARPADVVYRDGSVVAFLDRRPLFPGHLLVAPTAHVGVLGDLTPEQTAEVMRVVQAASRAMESALGADGSLVAVNNKVSQSVPHLHVHVIPRRFKDGLKGFFWPRRGYEYPEQLEEVAKALREGIARELGA